MNYIFWEIMCCPHLLLPYFLCWLFPFPPWPGWLRPTKMCLRGCGLTVLNTSIVSALLVWWRRAVQLSRGGCSVGRGPCFRVGPAFPNAALRGGGRGDDLLKVNRQMTPPAIAVETISTTRIVAKSHRTRLYRSGHDCWGDCLNSKKSLSTGNC